MDRRLLVEASILQSSRHTQAGRLATALSSYLTNTRGGKGDAYETLIEYPGFLYNYRGGFSFQSRVAPRRFSRHDVLVNLLVSCLRCGSALVFVIISGLFRLPSGGVCFEICFSLCGVQVRFTCVRTLKNAFIYRRALAHTRAHAHTQNTL